MYVRLVQVLAAAVVLSFSPPASATPEHDAASGATARRLLSACRYTLPWANPDVLAVYKVPKTVRTPAGDLVKTSSVVYPYRKYVKQDPSTGQWDYKSLTLKRGCTLTFDWTVPANKSKASQSRGVATSRISVCNITKGRYTYLTLAKTKSRYSVKLSSKGVVYFWDTYGRKPGQSTPSQTANPYDQFWPRCQFGVFVAVKVV